jgi:hypothetical protein
MDVNTKYISGERLQELVDLTVIFDDQRHPDLWQAQLPNTDCNYVVLKSNEAIPDIVLQSKSIFVYTHALDLFFTRVFPHIIHPIILMSHNSDWGINNAKYDCYLNSDKILKWYAQNVNHDHPKLVPLPIGIANSQWEHGNFQNILEVLSEKNIKSELVYNNFNCSTSPENRVHIEKALAVNNILRNPPTDSKTFLREVSKSTFCICPFGSGYDSHRIWEALYLNTIPVVPRCIGFSKFKDLPILTVNDWSSVDINFLNNAATRIQLPDYSMESLSIEYWRHNIDNNI